MIKTKTADGTEYTAVDFPDLADQLKNAGYKNIVFISKPVPQAQLPVVNASVFKIEQV